jgi:hypothetical protein
MTVHERRRLEMVERLGEVLGTEVTDTLLAYLPPHGERVATAPQIEQLRAETTGQTEQLRAETMAQFEYLRDEQRELRADVRELRRDLIWVTGGQFFALIAAVAAIVGLG